MVVSVKGNSAKQDVCSSCESNAIRSYNGEHVEDVISVVVKDTVGI